MPNPRFESILRLLFDEAIRAHMYNGIARAIREEIEAPEFWRGQTVLMASYYACLREFLLSLSKLLIPHDDSVTLPYLVDYAEQNPEGFAGGDAQTVRKFCTQAREVLVRLELLRGDIKMLRDDELAHIDKRQIVDPKLILSAPLAFKSLDEGVQQIIEFLNDFRELYMKNRFLFQDDYQVAREELRRLFGRK